MTVFNEKRGPEAPDAASAVSKTAARNWTVFAAAAGAALSMASNAEAGIIYTQLTSPIDVVLPATGSATPAKFFAIGGAPHITASVRRNTAWQGFAGVGSSVPHIGFAASRGGEATDFAFGALIGGNFGHQSANLDFVRAGGTASGNFPLNQTGFVGFRFGSGGAFNGDLGWIRVEVLGSGGIPDELKVIDYAYNNVSGAPITAGEGASSTPEPGTAALALLATGAAGLLAWRRRRKEATQA